MWSLQMREKQKWNSQTFSNITTSCFSISAKMCVGFFLFFFFCLLGPHKNEASVRRSPCKSNRQVLPNETNAAPDWKRKAWSQKRLRSATSHELFHSHSRLSLSQARDEFCSNLGRRRQFCNSPLIVANVQIESFCLTPRISFFLGGGVLGGREGASSPPLSSTVTLDIVSSSCWWLLFFSLSAWSRTGLFQLLLIHHRLDCLSPEREIVWFHFVTLS